MVNDAISTTLTIMGGATALLAGIGVLRFRSTYARLHAAGKASPVAFLVAAFGVGVELGWEGGAPLVVAAAAMVLTLPVGVHLLFRAVYRTQDNEHLVTDDLKDARDQAAASSPGAGD